MIDAPIVWLDDAGTHVDPVGAPVLRALATWANVRSFRVTRPHEGASASAAPLADPAVGQEVERALLGARESLARLDGEGTDHALARAEGLLRQNPALPQGAWLLAEVRRAWAVRHLRIEPRDEARAAREWAAAAALDGGRAAGLGEPTRGALTATAPVDVTLDADGSAELLLDGAHAARGPIKMAAGEHQLLALEDGRVVWGAWITVDTGTVVRVALPRSPSCSNAEFRDVALRGDDVVARNVRCGTWLAGDARSKDVLRVAVCEAAGCGTWIEVRAWDRDRVATTPPLVHHGFPAWATWTLVAAGALATTGLVLWGTGVFDPRGTTVQFTQGPVQPESLR